MNLERFDDARLEHHVAILNPLSSSRLGALRGLATIHECPASGPIARWRWLYRVIRGENIVLIHATLTEASRLAAAVASLTRIPVLQSLVNIAHEPIRSRDHPNVRRWKLEAHRLVDRVQVRVPTLFHAISARVADSWIENVGIEPSKIRVIPRGVESQHVNEHERQEWRRSMGFADSDVIVLSIARQEPQKRLWLAVEAVASLSDPAVHLVLVGRDGASTPRIRRIIDSIEREQVLEVGEVSDVTAILQGSDIFIYPSLYEGLGVALLEAMSVGLPVVTTDVEPMNWIVTKDVDGLLCPQDDDRCWFEKLEVLCRDEALRKAIGQAAQRTIRERFDIDVVATQIESLYLELLGLNASMDEEGRHE